MTALRPHSVFVPFVLPVSQILSAANGGDTDMEQTLASAEHVLNFLTDAQSALTRAISHAKHTSNEASIRELRDRVTRQMVALITNP